MTGEMSDAERAMDVAGTDIFMSNAQKKRDIILVAPLPDNGNKILITNPGLGSIAAFLRSHGMDCLLIDSSEIDEYRDRADVFGISVMDHTYASAQRVTQKLGRKTIIWGGWTATALPEFILQENPDVDYVILWEGEKRLLELLYSLRDPKRLDSIDGIAYRNGSKKIVLRPATTLLDLAELPFPTESCVLKELVFVEIARGCYGGCRYCQEHSSMRFKPAQNIADEVAFWHRERGYTYFYFGNANSLANSRQLQDLLKELEARDLRIKSFFVGRPDDVLRNYAVLEEIFASKYCQLHALEVGVEANTQHALDLLGRKSSPAINRDAMAALRKLQAQYSPDTRIHANMILFSHFDMTCDDFIENVRFIGEHQCSREVLSLQLYGVAGTPIWHDMKARGFQPLQERGLQITDYPFSDPDIRQLYERLIQQPLQKIVNKDRYEFSDYTQNYARIHRQCYRKIMEFYHSPDMESSVLDFIQHRDE